MEDTPKKKDYTLPASIVIAALLISTSLVYNAGKKAGGSNLTGNLGDTLGDPSPAFATLRPISETDHIRGEKNTSVTVVEFSDLECPFCKQFHATMKRVLQEYGGKVSWVYRHYPLDALHSKARKEAEASECANELGGNGKFWSYVDRVFALTPSNNGLDLTLLPQIAGEVGLDTSRFSSCLESGKYREKVETDVQDAERAGAQGTPYSVVIARDGSKYVLNGALPYEEVKVYIDQALR